MIAIKKMVQQLRQIAINARTSEIGITTGKSGEFKVTFISLKKSKIPNQDIYASDYYVSNKWCSNNRQSFKKINIEKKTRREISKK